MTSTLTLAQLRKLLVKGEARLGKLNLNREKILGKLRDVDDEIAGIEGGGFRSGRRRKNGAIARRGKRKMGRVGRPPKALTEAEAPKRRGRPPKAKAESTAGEPGSAERPKRGRKPGLKKETGPSLRDYLVRALETAGRAMTVEQLAAAVEKAGYSSKNTTQLIRMAIPRGPLRKIEDGRVRMA